jgi:hypothetical protein
MTLCGGFHPDVAGTPQGGISFALARLAAFRFVLKVLVGEKQLFPGGEDELRTAIHAVQDPVRVFDHWTHAPSSPCFESSASSSDLFGAQLCFEKGAESGQKSPRKVLPAFGLPFSRPRETCKQLEEYATPGSIHLPQGRSTLPTATWVVSQFKQQHRERRTHTWRRYSCSRRIFLRFRFLAKACFVRRFSPGFK